MEEGVDLSSTLAEPSPDYKPDHHKRTPARILNLAESKQNDDLLAQAIYSRSQRTKVYSGNKTGYTSVPTLYDICIRVLIENIEGKLSF